MTRTVFANYMVAHVWANGSQNSGRSNNGNFYFEGPTLYSYGSHYIAGYRTKAGECLVNTATYSISTSRHTSYAARAVGYGRAYGVAGLTDIAETLRDIENPGRYTDLNEARRALISALLALDTLPAGSNSWRHTQSGRHALAQCRDAQPQACGACGERYRQTERHQESRKRAARARRREHAAFRTRRSAAENNE